MKAKLVLLVSSLMGSVAIAQLPSQGLVAYYPLNGTANDYSGSGNHGAVFNVSSTTDRFQVQEKALAFNGTTSYINLGSKAALKMKDSITISLWFFANTIAPTYQNLISDHGINQSSVGAGKIMRLAEGKLQVIIGGLYGSATTPATYLEKAVEASKWYHAVFTYDRTTLKFYLNNTLVGTLPYTAQLSANPNDVLIGKSGFPNELFNGKIDQVRVYNRALKQSEVQALHEEDSQKAWIVNNSPTVLCKGGKVVLNATKGKSNYRWSNGKVNVDSIEVTGAGDYFVIANAVDTSNVVRVVNDSISTLFSTTQFVNTSALPITLHATPVGGTFSGNGVSNGKFNPSVAGLGTSWVHYSYNSKSNCAGKLSQKIIVYDTLAFACAVNDTLFIRIKVDGLADGIQENTLKVYPNPTASVLTIDNGDFATLTGYKIDIVNASGQSVYNSLIQEKKVEVNVLGWAKNGIYVLRLVHPSGQVVENRKIVVQE